VVPVTRASMETPLFQCLLILTAEGEENILLVYAAFNKSDFRSM